MLASFSIHEGSLLMEGKIRSKMKSGITEIGIGQLKKIRERIKNFGSSNQAIGDIFLPIGQVSFIPRNGKEENFVPRLANIAKVQWQFLAQF